MTQTIIVVLSFVMFGIGYFLGCAKAHFKAVKRHQRLQAIVNQKAKSAQSFFDWERRRNEHDNDETHKVKG